MKNTYSINLSTTKLINGNYGKKLYVKNIIRRLFYYFIRLLICIVTFCCLFYMFYIFDSNSLIAQAFSYNESIALGALFSTLGSSLVAITSVLSEHCIKNIDINIETLQESQLCRTEKWKRWPFISRISKHNLSKNEKEYYVYENPSILFENLKQEIYIPLAIKDFYELKIIWSYLVLKFKRKSFRKILAFQPNNNYLKDILIWDCLKNVYKTVIVYKFHKMFTYIGWSIVISSIIFSFSYPQLATYFDSIIFAISTTGA